VRDAARLQKGLEALAADVRGRPLCLVHGDAHAGNVYRDTGGALGLVDWQILQKGSWAMDVAYHLAAVLPPEVRRASERQLLADYCARLTVHGGPEIGADEAWRSYRIAMIYGYYLWSITRKVEPEIIDTFVHRLGTAVHDLESFELLGV
jgi:aminoglycoside phosphotransferase (APT) family kinase protein